MTYVGQFSSGDVLTAADMNTVGASCQVYVTSFTVPANTNQFIDFTNTITDLYGWHSPFTNPDRITVPVAGMYRVTFSATRASGSQPTRMQVRIMRNLSSAPHSNGTIDIEADYLRTMTVSALVDASAGQYFGGRIYQSNATSGDVNFTCTLAVTLVGAQ